MRGIASNGGKAKVILLFDVVPYPKKSNPCVRLLYVKFFISSMDLDVEICHYLFFYNVCLISYH